MLACYEDSREEKEVFSSPGFDILFIKSSSGTRVSPPALFDAADNDQEDAPPP
jgi:hypothetical protein